MPIRSDSSSGRTFKTHLRHQHPSFLRLLVRQTLTYPPLNPRTSTTARVTSHKTPLPQHNPLPRTPVQHDPSPVPNPKAPNFNVSATQDRARGPKAALRVRH